MNGAGAPCTVQGAVLCKREVPGAAAAASPKDTEHLLSTARCTVHCAPAPFGDKIARCAPMSWFRLFASPGSCRW
jgi:hypothetical protein